MRGGLIESCTGEQRRMRIEEGVAEIRVSSEVILLCRIIPPVGVRRLGRQLRGENAWAGGGGRRV